MIDTTGEVKVHRLTLASAAARLAGNAECMRRLSSAWATVGEPEVVAELARAAETTDRFARELAEMGGVDVARLAELLTQINKGWPRPAKAEDGDRT